MKITNWVLHHHASMTTAKIYHPKIVYPERNTKIRVEKKNALSTLAATYMSNFKGISCHQRLLHELSHEKLLSRFSDQRRYRSGSMSGQYGRNLNCPPIKSLWTRSLMQAGTTLKNLLLADCYKTGFLGHSSHKFVRNLNFVTSDWHKVFTKESK